MKKFVLICLCVLMGWNLSAQVAQTFIPNPDEVYYLKCQSTSTGRNTHFVLEALDTPNDTLGAPLDGFYALKFYEMNKEAAFETESYAGWKVQYVQDKGYMIQNVDSKNYWKYIGAYVPDPADAAAKAHIMNGICSAPLDESEIGRYYFEFRPSNTMTEIGNDDISFKIQGYSVVAVGTESVKTQVLDAYGLERGIGTWDYKGASDSGGNQYWWFVTEDDFTVWEAGIEAAKVPFSPVADQAYYIKNISTDRGFRTRYLMQDADSLIFKTMSEAEVKSHDNYKWYVELDNDTKIYRIKNKATGEYMKFAGAEGEGSKHGLVKMGGIEETRSDLSFEKARSTKVTIGIEGFPEVPTFSKQPYYIGFNFAPNEGLNGADRESAEPVLTTGNVRVTTWNSGHSDEVSNWIFMTDEDVDSYAAATNDSKFIPEEGVYYTFRPSNLSKTEAEDLKNTRLADAEDGSLILNLYDPEDESAQWEFRNISGTDKYYIRNRLSGNYMTVGKWYLPTIEGIAPTQAENEAAARSVVGATSFSNDNLNQQLIIVFKNYVRDEYGRASKIFGIGNSNTLEPESVGGGKENKTYFLDHLNKYLVDSTPGSWESTQPNDNQSFIIRTLENDQPLSSKNIQFETKESSVFTANRTITVISTAADCAISVYTINGALVKQTKEKQFSLINPGFYIVKVNMETFKVVIK